MIRNNTANQQITGINKNILQINELTGIDIILIDTSDLINNHLIAIQNFEIHRKSLYIARRIKNNNVLRDKIQGHIQNRYNNFSNNTTKMIDSILHRHIDCVQFQNITTPEEVITDYCLIQEHIRVYFKN